jgi:predicted RNA binding protein YcfA (HicA-like mRNA interferase family)
MNSTRVIEKLKKAGFWEDRQKGSHVVMKNDDNRIVVVPVHKGELIDRGLLMKIIGEAGLTRDEFLAL